MPARSVGHNASVMALGTLLSRVTGFLRILAVAYVFGYAGVADAYNYANSVPNVIYDLLLGGILSATLIPVFVEQLAKPDRKEADRAISAILTSITAALAALTLILYFLAPVVIRFYLLRVHSPGAPDERAIAVSLLHLFAPQVFFLGAIVVSTALLNAHRRFSAAAFSPVLNNVIAIAAILVTKLVAANVDVGPFRHDHRAVLILGIGTTAGYLVQLLVQIPAMRRAGISLRPVWNLKHPAVHQVLRLSAWLIGVVIANQVSLNLILVIAGHRTGDFTVYQTAYQFFQLPYALFAVSIASALTPGLAERWTRQDRRGFRRRMIIGVRVTLAVLIPAAAGYAVIAQPLIRLAVAHGHATTSAAHSVGATLVLFAVGLPGFSAFLLLMRAYQAMQDTRTMFWLYLFENGVTVIAAVALYPTLGIKGLALAWSAPYTLAAVVGAALLQRRIGGLGGSLTMRAVTRIFMATGFMVVILEGLTHILPDGDSAPLLVLRIVVLLAVGTTAFLAAARALGIKETRPIVRLARRILP